MVAWWYIIIANVIGIFCGFFISSLVMASKNWTHDDEEAYFHDTIR